MNSVMCLTCNRNSAIETVKLEQRNDPTSIIFSQAILNLLVASSEVRLAYAKLSTKFPVKNLETKFNHQELLRSIGPYFVNRLRPVSRFYSEIIVYDVV
jgi:hypothetical protein